MDTLVLMPRKTVQVRIPGELAQDIAIIAAALDQTVPEWVEGVLRTAVTRDLPKAAKIAKDRADSARNPVADR